MSSLEGDASGRMQHRFLLGRNHRRGRRRRRLAQVDPRHSSGWRTPVSPPASRASAETPSGSPLRRRHHGGPTPVHIAQDVAPEPQACSTIQVSRDGALGRCRLRCRGRGPRHGEPRADYSASVSAQLRSGQFGVTQSVGVPPFGDEIVFTQGSVKERRFAAAFGRRAASSLQSPSITASGWRLRTADRAIGPSRPRRRAGIARGHGPDAGRVSRGVGPDGDLRRRLDRPRPDERRADTGLTP